MTPPHLVSGYFGSGANEQWPRMARVLAYTAERNCAEWQRTIELLPPVPNHLRSAIGVDGHAANAHKQCWWADQVEQAADGQRMLLIDTDTFIVKPLDDVWDRIFDFAYTTRNASRFPLNGGVIFVRVSDRVRAFVRNWANDTIEMLAQNQEARIWRREFGGIAQAALGRRLSQKNHGLQIQTLPCVEWNCEDSAWLAYNQKVTRIIHVKSALRRGVFNLAAPQPAHWPLIHLWRAFERAVNTLHERTA